MKPKHHINNFFVSIIKTKLSYFFFKVLLSSKSQRFFPRTSIHLIYGKTYLIISKNAKWFANILHAKCFVIYSKPKGCWSEIFERAANFSFGAFHKKYLWDLWERSFDNLFIYLFIFFNEIKEISFFVILSFIKCY